MSRSWLRYPPRVVGRPPACRLGVQRFPSEEHAWRAIPIYDTTGQTPTLCGRCGGWHLTHPA